jgi:hypothetical protein
LPCLRNRCFCKALHLFNLVTGASPVFKDQLGLLVEGSSSGQTEQFGFGLNY